MFNYYLFSLDLNLGVNVSVNKLWTDWTMMEVSSRRRHETVAVRRRGIE